MPWSAVIESYLTEASESMITVLLFVPIQLEKDQLTRHPMQW